jgi:uncharacterized protein (UPF0248 family)
LSYAAYKDDPALFYVSYRDKDLIRRVSLVEFMKGEEFAEIPITRILRIDRAGRDVWSKGQKTVALKK